MKKPTTTHFAVLGLLAARPWSTYDLIQYMSTSYIQGFWTKTRARLYETPKELVKLGYAQARKERISKNPDATGRQRTVYSITPAGSAALKVWLKEPSQPPGFEDEALLRLAFADQGTLEDFLEQVRAMRAEIAGSGRPDVVEAAGTSPQVPSRVHLAAHMADLWDRMAMTRIEWLNDLEADASGWETVASTPENREAGMAHYRALAQRMKQEQRDLAAALHRGSPADEDETEGEN